MSEHTVYIEMNPTPEVLERILRVTRHRGFAVRQIQMAQNEDNSSSMAVTVSSERPISYLTRQLDKLFDVTGCRVGAEANAAPQAQACMN